MAAPSKVKKNPATAREFRFARHPASLGMTGLGSSFARDDRVVVGRERFARGNKCWGWSF